MAEKTVPAPDAKRCEAGATDSQPDGSCGAGQPLFKTNGLVHCYHHSDWTKSKEAKKLNAAREIDKAE